MENHLAHLDPTEQLAALRLEHAALEARLNELLGQPTNTAEEDLEVHRLKKLKLLRKDQIAQLADGAAASTEA